MTLKRFLDRYLTLLYKVEVHGLEHYHAAGKRVLIVANHTSFLDPLLLGVFLPGEQTFAINTYISENPWMKPFRALAQLFPMDPTNPLASKALIKHLKEDKPAVIFPEGRITVTGALMKIYDGAGMVADRSGAVVLPVRIEGALYTPFSRMRGRVRLRWFPKITLNILPGNRIIVPDEIKAQDRRKYAGRVLADMMTEMMFETDNRNRSLFLALLDARRIHGGKHIVMEDIERKPINYNQLITGAFVIANGLRKMTKRGEHVAILMPNVLKTVMVLFALQVYGRIPAMLNYTVGSKGMVSACQTAGVRLIVTSRKFVESAGLSEVVEAISQDARVLFLEDIGASITGLDKMIGLMQSMTAGLWYKRVSVDANQPAVVLFTSGSEGTPKGVVLSHANLLANRSQIAARFDFTAQDVVLNILPLFHSFGLTAGTLLPLLSGLKTFLYVSPLHYRVVPEIAYETNATILFGTNTFLAGYARKAHPYDFYSMRYVVAGAEKLQEETRRVWMSKFGIRIFEGYGVTETSPVLSVNTGLEYKEGSVGRMVPGVEARLDEVPGVKEGGRLHVRGANVMLGYLLSEQPGKLVPPSSKFGVGWYDTGDIVTFDDDGFTFIRGRAKRFAKIGGEMVSLAVAEAVAGRTWPEALHAVVALSDPKKGEQLVLLTEQPDASFALLRAHADGVGEINLPKKIFSVKAIPIMGSGKINYIGVSELAEKLMMGA